MTSEEYFAIAIPTDADFREWTRSFFARIDSTHARLKRRFPELYKVKVTKLEDLPLWN